MEIVVLEIIADFPTKTSKEIGGKEKKEDVVEKEEEIIELKMLDLLNLKLDYLKL